MKRATIIITIVAAGALSMAFAGQPTTPPAQQNPGTCLNDQPCLQDQATYRGRGLQQWQSPNGRQDHGRGMGRGVYRQDRQRQGYDQAFRNAERQGFGRGNRQRLTGNSGPMRQGRGRGMGRGFYRQDRQEQGYGRAFRNAERQGFGRGNRQCLTGNSGPMRQGRGQRGQGLGQGRQRRPRSQCNGGCGRRGRGCGSW
jgi:hypothetical protein